jgi:HPt (histidine-containing phosphotransfer) domain-containing protein
VTGDDAWLEPLRARFASRLGDEPAALRGAQARGDTETIIDRAHKLAGLAGMLGAPQVGEAALLLEETARSGSDYAAPLAALLAAIDDVRR